MSNSARIGAPGRIHEDPAWVVRRLAAVWVAAWTGMILLVLTLTIITLTSPATMISSPPEGYLKAVKLAGEPLMRSFCAIRPLKSTARCWSWAGSR